MNPEKPVPPRGRGKPGTSPHQYKEILHQLLTEANRGYTKLDFLKQASRVLLEFSSCDMVEIRVEEDGGEYRCMALLVEDGSVRLDCTPVGGQPLPDEEGNSVGEKVLERVIRGVHHRNFTAAAPFFTRNGSFWTGDAARPVLFRDEGTEEAESHTLVVGGTHPSLVLIPFPAGERSEGMLLLGSERRDFFSKEDVTFFETVAETLGVTLSQQAVQWALRKRLRAVTCLYNAASTTLDPDLALEPLLETIAGFLPLAFHDGEAVSARIVLGGRTYQAVPFKEGSPTLEAPIIVNEEQRGRVEIAHIPLSPEGDEEPGLQGERTLLDEIAALLGRIVAARGAPTTEQPSLD